MLNILIVWAATGIWHGAEFNFLLWGLYYALLLMIEKIWLLQRLERTPLVIRHIYALFFIALGWAIFAIPDATAGMGYLGVLFGMGQSLIQDGDIFQIMNYALLFAVLVIASVPLGKRVFHNLPDNIRNVIETVLIICGLCLSTAYLVDSTYNPFLYFRF